MTECFFHVSEVFNRHSILMNGILPKPITLPNHERQFKKDGLIAENENKLIYMIEDSEQIVRFIQDTVYGKVFITPRNKIALKIGDEFDARNFVNKNLYKYNSMTFDIYKVYNIKEALEKYRPYHQQIISDKTINTLYKMDTRFEHVDKVLVFSKTPEKNFSIVGKVEFNFTKRNKYDIKVKL